MGSRLLAWWAVVAATTACSEVVIEPEDAAGGAGGSGSSASSSKATTSSGGTTTTGFGTTDTSSSASGQGGFAGCVLSPGDEPFGVWLTKENVETLYEGCDADTFAQARVMPGGECGASTSIRACRAAGPPDLSYVFDATTTLIDVGEGILSGSTESLVFSDLQLTIESFGDVGEPIIGSYVGMTMNGEDPSIPISGRFKLCRGPDYLPCP